MKAIHVLALALVLSLLVAGLAMANSSAERPRHVVGSGMSDSTAAGVALRGTLGQAVIGAVSAGDVTLGQGFWHGVAAAQYRIYLPLVLRQSEG